MNPGVSMIVKLGQCMYLLSIEAVSQQSTLTLLSAGSRPDHSLGPHHDWLVGHGPPQLSQVFLGHVPQRVSHCSLWDNDRPILL